MTNALIGVVLSGGESKRMGSDKGLIPEGDSIRAKFVGDKMAEEGLKVYYTINENQSEAYSEFINRKDLIFDSNDCPGPLRGLISAHQQFPNSDILLLACDMLDITPADIRRLITAREVQQADFFAYRQKEFFETFCAIYTANALSKINSNDCANLSLQKLLKSGNTFELEIGNIMTFANYNAR